MRHPLQFVAMLLLATALAAVVTVLVLVRTATGSWYRARGLMPQQGLAAACPPCNMSASLRGNLLRFAAY